MLRFFAEFELDKFSRPDQSTTDIPDVDTINESRVMIQNVV
jgi:hypothetical protein